MKHGKGWKLCLVAAVVLAGLGTWAHLAAQAGGAAGAAGAAAASAGDWATYRGPNANGISNEKGWSSSWTAAPKEVWKASVGKGYSSVAVAGGKVYTMGNATGKEDTVWCLDAKASDGGKAKVIWQKSYACGSAKDNPGPRATPTVDGELVYTISRQGHINCWDAAKGDLKWSRNAVKDYGCKVPTWGFSGSAVVIGDEVIFELGKVLALNKKDGNRTWESPTLRKSGYAGVAPLTVGDKKCLAGFSGEGLAVVEMGTGKEVSFFPWKTAYDVSAATPLISGDKVFISTGYGTGCALVDPATGKSDWTNKKMCNHCATCVLSDGFLYGFNGQAGPGGALVCMDIKDGSVKWEHKGLGTGSVLIADGKLILQGATGDLAIAEVNPKEYKELAKAKPLSGECWTQAVLSSGMIYCRNTDGDLVALDVSGK